ncbi:MAG: hypothetical protein J6X57_04325, partial [Bacteroidales bacterium]|nr:hypothetical protein [Bacteroidales bacterium]
DIAAVMGIPAGSVKAYLSRGREKLKTELKDESL